MRKLLFVLCLALGGLFLLGSSAQAHDAKAEANQIEDVYDDAVDDAKDVWHDARNDIEDEHEGTAEEGRLTQEAALEYLNTRVELAEQYHRDLLRAYRS